eukprot:m.353056 g.353056  ORF g.353056 m.353056 type:complete len:500 (+) comp16675_c0_seq1:342-1841(+)
MSLTETDAPLAILRADMPEELQVLPILPISPTNSEDDADAPAAKKEKKDKVYPAVSAIALDGSAKEHIRATLGRVIKTGMMEEEHAFFLVDLGSVYRQHKLFMTELPSVTPFYAVKCNPDPMIVNTLASLGASFDCASRTEIEAVLNIGVDASRIIYANPCKPTSHIRFAKSVGVKMMTFDSEEELVKIQAVYPTSELVLRILADDSKSTSRLGLKFGAALGKQTTRLLHAAQRLNLSVVGVSFHVGSGCSEAAVYDDAIAKARTLFDEASALGMTMTLLDIGGGFPGEDVAGEAAKVTFPGIAAVVRNAISTYFEADYPDLRVIAEPGRFYAANAMTLALNVIAKRVIASEKRTPSPASSTLEGMLHAGEPTDVAEDAAISYFVSDGVYGSFNCIIFDHADVVLEPVHAVSEDAPLHPSTIWGPTCDSIDCVSTKCMLPELSVGDWLYAPRMGAYTGCAASTFNGFAKADYIYTFSLSPDMDVTALPDDFPLDVAGLQ